MLSLLRNLVAPLLVAVPAVAQMSASAHLVTGSLTAGSAFAPMPSGSALGTSFTNGCTGACGTSSIALGQSATIEHLDFGVVATCQAISTGTTVAEATVRYDFVTPLSFVGRFVVTWNFTNGGTGASSLDVDLGADGSIDANGSTVLPVVFGPGAKSLQLRIRSQAVAGVTVGPFGSLYPFQGSASATALVRLEPTHCQAQPTGAPCGLSQFDVTNDLLRGVKLEGAVRPIDDVAILVLGFAPTALPIGLQTNCLLRVDPAIMVWQVAYFDEVPTWGMSLPAALLPVTFHAQHFGLDFATASVAGSAPLQLVWQ